MTEVCYAWRPDLQGIKQDYKPEGVTHGGRIIRIREYRDHESERIERLEVPGILMSATGTGRSAKNEVL